MTMAKTNSWAGQKKMRATCERLYVYGMVMPGLQKNTE